jgi:hypothetical protein
MDADGQLPDEQVLMVAVVEGPANLYLTFDPSVGTVIETVQEGNAVTVWALPSKAIFVGFTSHPVNNPVPTGPPVATVMLVWTVTDARTVSDAEAVFPPASTTVKVWEPIGAVGTVRMALNEPDVDEVTIVGNVATAVPSNLTVMAEDDAKPLPETVTFEPVMLLVGLTLMDELMVNVADELSDDASMAWTRCTPWVEEGAWNVALNDPMDEEATVVGEVETVEPSYLIVIVDDEA